MRVNTRVRPSDSGKWIVEWDIHEEGRQRIRKQKTIVAQNKKQAMAKALKLAEKFEHEGFASLIHRYELFGDFAAALADKGWLSANKKKILRYSTLDDYRNRVKTDIIPYFGTKKLTQISKADVSNFEEELDRRGLSVTSRRHHIQVLRNIMQMAIWAGIVSSNPCDDMAYSDSRDPGVDPEAEDEEEKVTVWDSDQVAIFINAALKAYPMPESPTGALLALSALTGCRLGECLGFRWKNAVLAGDRPYIDVKSSLSKVNTLDFLMKSAAAHRTIPLNSRAAQILRQWRLASAETGPDARIFPLKYFAYRSPFLQVTKKAQLPQIRFHDLRASWCSNAFLRIHASSTNANIIQELTELSRAAGHSSFNITYDFYIKVTKGLRSAVPKAIEGYGE